MYDIWCIKQNAAICFSIIKSLLFVGNPSGRRTYEWQTNSLPPPPCPAPYTPRRHKRPSPEASGRHETKTS